MEYNYSTKDPSCSESLDGSISLNISNYSGRLFINWINLPYNSIITNDGKNVSNLGAGEYFVEIEDDEFYAKTKKTIAIILNRKDPLRIDFVQVSQPKCYDDYGSIIIFIEGGTAPYNVSMGQFSGVTESKSIEFINIPNNSIFSKITITDKNLCSYTYNDSISFTKDKINIELHIDGIPKFGNKCPKVVANITGATSPYKIGWYDSKQNIIATNVKELKDALNSGHYLIKVIDHNNCIKSQNFYIEEPSPIVVDYSAKADYSYNSLFSYCQIQKIHNLILIPKKNHEELCSIIPGNTIYIVKDKNTIEQVAVIHSGDIKLFNNEYYYFYIGNGIKIKEVISLVQKKYKLKYKDKEYPLSLSVDKKLSCKLLIGGLVLDTNYDYAFNNNDLLELNIDNNIIQTKLYQKLNKYNFYSAMTTTTVLLFLDNNTVDALKALNPAAGFNSAYVRSLTTRKNNQKGSIYLKIVGGVGNYLGVSNNVENNYKYRIDCWCEANKYYQTFYTSHILNIQDLVSGEYSIKIIDIGGNTINFINGQKTLTDTFTVKILGSEKEEQETIMNKLIEKYNITPLPPQKTLTKFKRVRQPKPNMANCLLNISNTSEPIEIIGPNFHTKISQSYYLIENLIPGKYTVKSMDKTKDIFLVQNNTHYLDSLD